MSPLGENMNIALLSDVVVILSRHYLRAVLVSGQSIDRALRDKLAGALDAGSGIWQTVAQ